MLSSHASKDFWKNDARDSLVYMSPFETHAELTQLHTTSKTVKK